MEQVNEISLEGFQVVSGDFFTMTTRTSAPTFTLWDGSIGFSKQDILLLNSCENVRIHINSAEKKIIVIPTTSSDKDALRWIKKLKPVEARKVSCVKFTDKLYETWKFDKDYIYRSMGKIATSGNKVMLLFDFSSPEKWRRPEAKNGTK